MNFGEWIEKERKYKPDNRAALFDAWQAALQEALKIAEKWEEQAVTPQGKQVARAIAYEIKATKYPPRQSRGDSFSVKPKASESPTD